MSSRKTDFSIEQQIYLGGQISQRMKHLQTLAILGENIDLYDILVNWDKIKKEPNVIERAKIILYVLGEAAFIDQCTELTRLSMILGDTSHHHSFKSKEKEENDS